MKKAYITIAAVIIVASAAGAAAANLGRGFFNPERHQAMIEKKAEMLGLDVDALQAKLDEGQTMREIFEEEGITKEELMVKRQAQIEEHLNTLVEEGKITQEQADGRLQKIQEMQQKMEERIENCPGECRDCMMGMMGRPKMGRGMGMMRPFVEDDE